MKPRALEQPASDQDGLMRPVLIEDQVDREVARHVGLSGLKELAKLNGPVPSMRLPDDSLRIQRRKLRGGAMTSVVMAAPLGLPRLQVQQRLASIQCLDLRLLIDPQDEGLVWRTHKRPTMSRTFSMNNGSVDSLNVSVRCGCNPNARQIRQTALWLRPAAVAIVRLLQCVASGGRVSKVLLTTSSTCASVIRRGAPGLGSPAIHPAAVAGSAAATC